MLDLQWPPQPLPLSHKHTHTHTQSLSLVSYFNPSLSPVFFQFSLSLSLESLSLSSLFSLVALLSPSLPGPRLPFPLALSLSDFSLLSISLSTSDPAVAAGRAPANRARPAGHPPRPMAPPRRRRRRRRWPLICCRRLPSPAAGGWRPAVAFTARRRPFPSQAPSTRQAGPRAVLRPCSEWRPPLSA